MSLAERRITMAEFVDVIKKYREMCDSYGCHCTGCPLEMFKNKHKTAGNCNVLLKSYPEETEEIIMSWQKPIDWSEVKVDTKIFVRDVANIDWVGRHFARFENGRVYAWDSGTTSFTAPDDKYITAWDFAKLAEEGEQNDE